MFEMVKRMNEAFGNPEGDPRDFEPVICAMESNTSRMYNAVAWSRLQKQCENIGGRLYPNLAEAVCPPYGEIDGEVKELLLALEARNIDKVRDALCDIMVFALGAYHFTGYDADADMAAVLAGVMTRFCKDQDALDRTLAKWAALGVTDVYTQGQFPRLCVKSGSDQKANNGDFCPKGKFLKSADYADTVFPPAPVKVPVPPFPPILPTLFDEVAPQRRRTDKDGVR